MGFFKSKKLELPPLPPIPTAGDAASKAKEDIIKKRRRMSQTILTSPQGVTGAATTERKTLLGG